MTLKLFKDLYNNDTSFISDKHHLVFGNQISSNNSFDGSDYVTVDTTDYILWTMSTL